MGVLFKTDEQQLIASFVLLAIVIMTFLNFSLTFWRNMKECWNFPVQINCLRVIFCAPFFGFIMWLIFFNDNRVDIYEIFYSLYEAFVVYCFFGILVHVSGGESEVCATFPKTSSKYRCICCRRIPCCFEFQDPQDLLNVYRKGIQQLLFTKPSILIIVAILDKIGKNTTVLRVITIILTAWAFLSLLQIYFFVAPKLTQYSLGTKFVAFKVLVISIAIQQSLLKFSFGSVGSGSGINITVLVHELLAIISICECFIFSIIFEKVYSPSHFKALSIDNKILQINPSKFIKYFFKFHQVLDHHGSETEILQSRSTMENYLQQKL